MKSASAYVIGGSGYTGGELLRMLGEHPNIGEIFVSSRSLIGRDASEIHRGLPPGLSFEDFDASKADSCDFVFTCTPHTKAMEFSKNIKKAKIVDLSADFRLKDYKIYEDTYKVKHSAKELLGEAVYGLPEIHRKEIKKARIVANPGCLASGAILALYPLAKEFGATIERVVIDSKTGISGAGKEATDDTHFAWVNENVRPYQVTCHRHVPEIEQECGMGVHFTPHVVPLTRGIQTTLHVFTEADDVAIIEAYEKAYANEPFTRVTKYIPTPLEVRGSNNCLVGGFARDCERFLVFSAMDNLVKGASGQAIQNMNIMAGWDETLGLETCGLCP